ncbi:hypothetical protein FEZ33_00470 [Ruoffia tabacinasalis]|uniref:Uncharacterized protein n=1 Tax=Ruoffia tabacinasalis TaxID=87458 RepID=A0A5R9EG45_9LACT|nr:hypothetical protein [Ruoffia tabacinasalis]TLQ49495.1 hypothetical protein FEZ33_00470 [Ruoffia tabacinasalis]
MKFDTRKKEKELIKKKFIPDKKGVLNKKKRFSRVKKNQKTKSQKNLTTLDLLPYKTVVGEDNVLQLNEGFMDILELKGYNMAGMDNEDLLHVIYQYESLVKMYVFPFKLITLYSPLDTSAQQKYYLDLINETTNLKHKKLLMETYYEMKWFQNNNYNKEFYFMIYADTLEELRECRNDFMQYKGDLSVGRITLEKKRAILFKLNNPTSKIFN